MARRTTPGEMRTIIKILKPRDNLDGTRHRNIEYANIYDDDRTIRCQWTGAFGTEAVTAYSLHQTAPATVTMRFDPRVTGDCVVDKIDGDRVTRYKIITDPNDVGDAHRWLEFKVTRKGAAM